jgi:hypothetical protein
VPRYYWRLPIKDGSGFLCKHPDMHALGIQFKDIVDTGAISTVFRNTAAGLIVKIYNENDMDTFQKEANLLHLASSNIQPRPVPVFFGAYQSEDSLCLIMADAGEPIKGWDKLTDNQK